MNRQLTAYLTLMAFCATVVLAVAGCGIPNRERSKRLSKATLLDSIPTDSVVIDTAVLTFDTLSKDTLSVTDSLNQDTQSNDSLLMADSVALADEPLLDSLDQSGKAIEALDSLSDDTTSLVQRENPIKLDAPIDFTAQDSMVMVGTSELYFFGPSKVNYQSMNIEAEFMRINADSSDIYAQYVIDSLGHARAYPKFTDGDQTFETKSMKYNFLTEQGYITGVVTEQEGGYVTSDMAKRMPDNTMFLENGRYTTCDLHDNPHFYLALTKAKAKPEDKIVSGPVYLVFAGVPIYFVGLPFAYFPFNSKRTSGIVLPKYGIDNARGLYLRDFGLYLNFNDYFDVMLKGDVYTNGSWGVNARSSYKRRYKYNGSLDIGFVTTVRGEKAIPKSYSKSRDFSVKWSHSQDPKADPLRTFSASVDFSTSSYNHNSMQNMQNAQVRPENNKGSSVSYTRRFQSIPLTITAAFNIDQSSRDSTLSVTLPNLNISLGTIYPFKRKVRMGKERWYEKIAMSYNGSLRNSIKTKEDKILKASLLKDWRNGMRHSIPISASFDLFNYIKLSPSFSYNAMWHTSKVTRQYDPDQRRVIPTDTTYGFYHLNDFNASLSMSTTLYGFYKPWKIFGDKVQMIRHRMSPSVSLNYQPDFGTPFWGYYKTIDYVDDQGKVHSETYSPFQGGLMGVPSNRKNGRISFSVDNNLEMKYRAKSDTAVVYKKRSLIDQFRFSSGYNLAADSFQWDNISASIALRFTQKFTLRLNGQFDTYMYDYKLSPDGKPIPYKVNKLRLLNGKGFGRLVGTGTSFSYQFTPETFKKWGKTITGWFAKNEDEDDEEKPKEEKKPGMSLTQDDGKSDNPTPDSPNLNRNSRGGQHGGDAMDEYDEYGYLKTTVPWSFSFNYSLNLGYDRQNFNIETKEYRYRFTQNLTFRGQIQPTRNWNLSFDANYNFDLKRVTNMHINITRDMHCWYLTCNIIPIGNYKSYSLTLGVTGQLLQDLKWEQNSLPSRGNYWYRK